MSEICGSCGRPVPPRMLARERAVRTLRELVQLAPDMRIGQIIIAGTPERFGNDPFNVTDEELAENLFRFYSHLMGQ